MCHAGHEFQIATSELSVGNLSRKQSDATLPLGVEPAGTAAKENRDGNRDGAASAGAESPSAGVQTVPLRTLPPPAPAGESSPLLINKSGPERFGTQPGAARPGPSCVSSSPASAKPHADGSGAPRQDPRHGAEAGGRQSTVAAAATLRRASSEIPLSEAGAQPRGAQPHQFTQQLQSAWQLPPHAHQPHLPVNALEEQIQRRRGTSFLFHRARVAPFAGAAAPGDAAGAAPGDLDSKHAWAAGQEDAAFFAAQQHLLPTGRAPAPRTRTGRSIDGQPGGSVRANAVFETTTSPLTKRRSSVVRYTGPTGGSLASLRGSHTGALAEGDLSPTPRYVSQDDAVQGGLFVRRITPSCDDLSRDWVPMLLPPGGFATYYYGERQSSPGPASPNGSAPQPLPQLQQQRPPHFAPGGAAGGGAYGIGRQQPRAGRRGASFDAAGPAEVVRRTPAFPLSASSRLPPAGGGGGKRSAAPSASGSKKAPTPGQRELPAAGSEHQLPQQAPKRSSMQPPKPRPVLRLPGAPPQEAFTLASLYKRARCAALVGPPCPIGRSLCVSS